MLDIDNLIASPALKPNEELENAEIAECIRELIRKNVPAHRRVILSDAKRVGSLADAVEDYPADLQTQTLENVCRYARSRKTSSIPLGRLVFTDSPDNPGSS